MEWPTPSKLQPSKQTSKHQPPSTTFTDSPPYSTSSTLTSWFKPTTTAGFFCVPQVDWRIRHNRSPLPSRSKLSDFQYQDERWETVLKSALNDISFEGVTVSRWWGLTLGWHQCEQGRFGQRQPVGSQKLAQSHNERSLRSAQRTVKAERGGEKSTISGWLPKLPHCMPQVKALNYGHEYRKCGESSNFEFCIATHKEESLGVTQ